MSELLNQIWQIVQPSVLFNSHLLAETMAQPEFMIAAFVALTLIVFTETGLLIGFFLPGDSLLVTAGLVAYLAGWNVPLLITILCAAAIIGDSVGYSIGFASGPRLFQREKSIFFAKDHLLKAQEFYEKYGGITVVLARFMPFLRTFAPVVAGIGKMNYPKFLFYNIFGGIFWVVSMILTGYFLTTAINPLFRPIFGPQFDVKDHIEKVIVLVVVLSVLPIVWGVYRSWQQNKATAASIPPSTPNDSAVTQVRLTA